MKAPSAVVFLFLILSPPALLADEWYEGGTLHRATAQQWHEATRANRLATAADFAASIDSSIGMDALRDRAEALRRCITVATADRSTRNLKVSEVAAACAIQLGYA